MPEDDLIEQMHEPTATKPRRSASRAADKEPARQTTDDVEPVVVRMSDVEPEAVTWLWPGRIAVGKLTILSGDPGLGKSFLTLDMIARISRGRPWADCRDADNPAGSAVILSAEDDVADTIRPRLDAAQADVCKVITIPAIRRTDPETGQKRECPFILGRDLPALERAVTDLGDCRLVVVDPISAYLGGIDSHVNAEIRALLAPLAAMAAKLRVAVVAVHHLNKNGGRAIYRSSGSLAFVAAARAVWAVAVDPEDPTHRRRLLVPIKNNLGPDQGGLAYVIETNGDDKPFIQWDAAPVMVTADDALAEPRPGRPAVKVSDAAKWLKTRLASGGERSEVLFKEGAAAGHTGRTLLRAKDVIGAKARKSSFDGGWVWLPPEADEASSDSASDDNEAEECQFP